MSRPSRWTSRAARPSRPSLPGAEVRRDQDARQRCGRVAQSGAHQGDLKGRSLRYGGTFRRGRQGHRTGRRRRHDLEPVLLAHACADGGAGRKARHHADGGAAVPRLLQPETIRDTLHAYQMAKRCNEKRITAQAVEWGERGARLNDIAPASSSRRWHSTSSTARAAASTRTCSLSAPRDAPARRTKSQTSPSF